MGLLRDLFGDRPDAELPGASPSATPDVSHRVLVRRTAAQVWDLLVRPEPGDELGVDCVGVLSLPANGRFPEFAGVWRRPDGRLRAGLATVVDLEHGSRVVVEASDGETPLRLVTTLEAADDGCVVTQRLSGPACRGAAAAFARAWLVRGLLAFRADAEGLPRGPWADPDADAVVHGHRDAGFAPTLGQPGLAPVTERAAVELALTPDAVSALLREPEAERLLKTSVEHLLRTTLADAPGTEHVLAVHRHDDGRRAASVSLVTAGPAPFRVVERDLTAPHEADVETTVEPVAGGCRVTSTLTAWLPAGPDRVVDGAPLREFLRARLEVLRHLAEHGVAPPRDPRAGFGPPDGAVPQADPQTEVARVKRGDVPSSVLLPPPHVASPATGYQPDRSTWLWTDFIDVTRSDVDHW